MDANLKSDFVRSMGPDYSMDARVSGLATNALEDVDLALRMVKFGGVDLTLEERLAFAAHPGTADTISDLANRPNDAKDNLIRDRDGNTSLAVSPDGSHLILVTDEVTDPQGPRCPYAKNERTGKTHPTMLRFVRWAGPLAVHAAEIRRRR